MGWRISRQESLAFSFAPGENFRLKLRDFLQFRLVDWRAMPFQVIFPGLPEYGRKDISHPHQIVSGGGPGEHPGDPGSASMTSFAEMAHGFDPVFYLVGSEVDGRGQVVRPGRRGQRFVLGAETLQPR